MSGTLAFDSSFRLSFVKPVKAAHIKDTLFYSGLVYALCVGRGLKIIKYFFYLQDDGSQVNALVYDISL